MIAPGGADLPDLRYKNAGEAFRAALLGACIGLAIIVPGVSGAAVAILFGLYEKLLAAIGGIFKRFRACALFWRRLFRRFRLSRRRCACVFLFYEKEVSGRRG